VPPSFFILWLYDVAIPIYLVYVNPALKKTLERLKGEAYACSGGLRDCDEIKYR
jgi:hypothetical protein